METKQSKQRFGLVLFSHETVSYILLSFSPHLLFGLVLLETNYVGVEE
jgi:hypothetical protein